MSRLIVVAAIAVVAFFGIETAAWAKPHGFESFPIKGTHSKDELQNACKNAEAAGDTVDYYEYEGAYSCQNLSTGTGVSCDAKGHCHGVRPARTAPAPEPTVKSIIAWHYGLPKEDLPTVSKKTLEHLLGLISATGAQDSGTPQTGAKPKGGSTPDEEDDDDDRGDTPPVIHPEPVVG